MAFTENNSDKIKDDGDATFLIINIVSLLFILIIGVVTITLLIKRKEEPALKRRSPKLLIISTVGNFSFCVLLLLQQIIYQSCLLNNHNSYCFKGFTKEFDCFVGLLLITVCEPLSMIPYVLRSIRLYVIFKAQEYYFAYKKKPANWLKWIKEK